VGILESVLPEALDILIVLLDQPKERSGAWVARPVKGRIGFDLREERGSLPAMGLRGHSAWFYSAR
jgi:hypothetical protein